MALTWLLLIVLTPLGLWLLGAVVEEVLRARHQAAMRRDRAVAEALLREWTRLAEAVDLDPGEALREAERIIGGRR